jgi:ferredoxin
MANVADRVPESIPGRFYVDTSCIYCELCVLTAPMVFKEERSQGWAYVSRQPVSPEEIAAAIDALEGCPTESIGEERA